MESEVLRAVALFGLVVGVVLGVRGVWIATLPRRGWVRVDATVVGTANDYDMDKGRMEQVPVVHFRVGPEVLEIELDGFHRGQWRRGQRVPIVFDPTRPERRLFTLPYARTTAIRGFVLTCSCGFLLLFGT